MKNVYIYRNGLLLNESLFNILKVKIYYNLDKLSA